MEGLLEKIKDGALPVQGLAAIAKGIVPLDAEQLIPALSLVCRQNQDLLGDAKATFRDIPDPSKAPYFGDRAIDADVLDFCLRHFEFPSDAHQAALLNSTLKGETLEAIAPALPADLLDIAVNNQVKIQECPSIIEGLQKNPNLGIIHKQKLEEYGRLLLKPLVSKAEELESKSIAEIEKEAIAHANEHVRVFGKEKVSREMVRETESEIKAAERAERAGPAAEKPEPEQVEEAEQATESLLNQIQNMSVPQKVQMAIKGNREMRGILVRDSNKQVCSAVIKSPKITEAEIEFIANLRNVQAEVLRLITMNREWLKSYKIVHSLVKNPRTPIAQSMKLIHRVNKKDMAALLRDKNVPEALRTWARRNLMSQRR